MGAAGDLGKERSVWMIVIGKGFVKKLHCPL